MLPELYRTLRALWLAPVLLLLACSGNDTGPVDVRLDRDACEHCRMVLSDPRFVAEIRYFPPGKHSKVAKFDDIGCAIAWLEDKPWKSDSKTEIWVADHRTKKWIDARTATYVDAKSTPMDYGLAAQSDPAPGGISFAQAIKKIEAVEERFNEHGLQLHHPDPKSETKPE
ncbi:MAG TPA: hypothetical protein ENJ11_08565 [Gammaproteobacteria bacterium]|nr:hypothetical protein [Gammaproteobacteria bacterium]